MSIPNGRDCSSAMIILVQPNGGLQTDRSLTGWICTSAAPCWVALSISTAGHVQVCPRPTFSTFRFPLHVWGSGPISNTCFLGPTRVHISTDFAGLTVVNDRWHYSVCSNRPVDAACCYRPRTMPAVTQLGSLVVRALDLHVECCKFNSGTLWPSLGGQTTSVFHQAIQANSASYPERGGKWVQTKVQWCSVAGE